MDVNFIDCGISRGSSCGAGGRRTGGLPCVSSECTRMLRLHRGKKWTVVSIDDTTKIALFPWQLHDFTVLLTDGACLGMGGGMYLYVLLSSEEHGCTRLLLVPNSRWLNDFFPPGCTPVHRLYIVLSCYFPLPIPRGGHISYSSAVHMCRGMISDLC